MAAKIHDYGAGEWGFHCPACGYGHSFRVAADTGWEWNGSIDLPTFTPSLLVNKDFPEFRCHSYVTDGRIRYLNDCWHSMKGQTVELPDWQEAL